MRKVEEQCSPKVCICNSVKIEAACTIPYIVTKPMDLQPRGRSKPDHLFISDISLAQALRGFRADA